MRRSLTTLGLALVAPLVAFADAPTNETAPATGDAIELSPSPAEAPSWALRPVPRVDVDDGSRWLLAQRHNALVFASRSQRHGRGMVRRGTALAGTPVAANGECDGRWFKVDPGGYVCTAAGFRALPSEPESPSGPEPALGRPLPYRYAMVTDREAYRFEYLPSRRLRERVRRGANLPDVAEQLDGDYFVAVASEEAHQGETWLRTVSGDYVRAAAAQPIEGSELSGVHDAEGLELPLAFVFTDGTELTHPGGRRRPATKYARFGVVSVEGDTVVGVGGIRAPRASVRLVERIERPTGVPPGAKWIHVDLDEQTIVAYQGDAAVFASLVATGKEGYDTPAGTFRIRHKYVSITMSGEDPHDGVYDVAEVPWTMYYDRSFALHGAYWHDSFGDVRSHGCTNIAPADARFLFTWTTPRLPESWHGVRADGTWVHLTRDEPDPSEGDGAS